MNKIPNEKIPLSLGQIIGVLTFGLFVITYGQLSLPADESLVRPFSPAASIPPGPDPGNGQRQNTHRPDAKVLPEVPNIELGDRHIGPNKSDIPGEEGREPKDPGNSAPQLGLLDVQFAAAGSGGGSGGGLLEAVITMTVVDQDETLSIDDLWIVEPRNVSDGTYSEELVNEILTIRYVPDSGFIGRDQVAVAAIDSAGVSAKIIVDIDVPGTSPGAPPTLSLSPSTLNLVYTGAPSSHRVTPTHNGADFAVYQPDLVTMRRSDLVVVNATSFDYTPSPNQFGDDLVLVEAFDIHDQRTMIFMSIIILDPDAEHRLHLDHPTGALMAIAQHVDGTDEIQFDLSGFNFQSIPEGDHNLYIVSTDEAGENHTSAAIVYTVDYTAPNLTLPTSPAHMQCVSGDSNPERYIDIEGGFADDQWGMLKVSYSIGGGNSQDLTDFDDQNINYDFRVRNFPTAQFGDLQNYQASIDFEAKDRANNVTPGNYVLRIDNRIPFIDSIVVDGHPLDFFNLPTTLNPLEITGDFRVGAMVEDRGCAGLRSATVSLDGDTTHVDAPTIQSSDFEWLVNGNNAVASQYNLRIDVLDEHDAALPVVIPIELTPASTDGGTNNPYDDDMIINPVDGATLVGVVPVMINPEPNLPPGTDPNPDLQVEVYLNDIFVGRYDNPPPVIDWDTRNSPVGPYEIRVVVIDRTTQDPIHTPEEQPRVNVTVVHPGSDGDPDVEITNLNDGDVVSGDVPIIISAGDDDDPIQEVIVLIDGEELDRDLDYPYIIEWDTLNPREEDGDHVITVIVPNPGDPENPIVTQVTVRVDNEPPVIISIEPQDGETLDDPQIIIVDAEDQNDPTRDDDDGEIDRVEITIYDENGNPIGDGDIPTVTLTERPFEYRFPTGGLPDGEYDIEITVVDEGGNPSEDSPVRRTVIVNNGGGGDPGQESAVVLSPAENSHEKKLITLRAQILNVPMNQLLDVRFKINGDVYTFIPTRPGLEHIYEFTLDTNSDGEHSYLFDGVYSFHVIARPGNPDNIRSENTTFFIDNTAPTVEFTFPQPNVGQENIFFGNQVIKARGRDALQLQRIEFSIGSINQSVDVFNNDEDVIFQLNTLQEEDGERIFQDHSSYFINAQAFDRAGNGSEIIRMDFTVDNINPPATELTLTKHPIDQSLVFSDAGSQIYLELSMVPDLGTILDDSFKVTYTKDGVTNDLDGLTRWVPETQRIVFTPDIGSIPHNAKLDISIQDLRDQEGAGISAEWSFRRAMQKAIGGEVIRTDDEGNQFKVFIPAGCLMDDMMVHIESIPEEDLPLRGITASAFGSGNDVEIVFEPVDTYGCKRYSPSGECIERVHNLECEGDVFYLEATSPTGSELTRHIDIQVWNDGHWIRLGSSADGQDLSARNNVEARRLSTSLSSFKIFQVTSFSVPNEGIANVKPYPNPVNPLVPNITGSLGVVLEYFLWADAHTQIIIYDLYGNFVRKLEYSPGQNGGRVAQNEIVWDARNGVGEIVANGGYLIQIIAEDLGGRTFKAMSKLAVIK